MCTSVESITRGAIERQPNRAPRRLSPQFRPTKADCLPLFPCRVKLSNRSILLCIAGFVGLVIAVSRLGFHAGSQPPGSLSAASRPPIRPTTFVVRGHSMMPTLRDGDLCQLDHPTGQLKIGDVVATRFNGADHVKRVAALAGDQVSLDRGRLLVNGRRLEDWFAERQVELAIPPGNVRVATSPDDWHVTDDGRWLVLTTRNPYRDGAESPVLDDYPGNTEVRRGLNPVDRLLLVVNQVDHDSRVVFFVDQHLRFTEVFNRRALSRFGSLAASSDGSLPTLDAAHPVAVELPPSNDAVDVESRWPHRFELWREIEYRDDIPRRRANYPLEVEEGQVFVVGDNVPVSIDSREVGSVPEAAIFGQVSAVRSPGIEALED